jgi:PIN domain nuclease of toxin-antitoxin system
VKAVLDASALLAYLQDEPRSETIEPMLDESTISSVNWAEVV